MADFGMMVLAAVAIMFSIAMYFLPTIVAVAAKNHNASAIFVLNFLMGWLIIPWVIALIWALIKPAPQQQQVFYVPMMTMQPAASVDPSKKAQRYDPALGHL